ncbi:redoxin domain-containing protein [Halovenus sp. WSH3]|uniref:Redoxin domain-containing protein n=1 Tax=Halovenus carboxidivorans TaxID=2692199 RepID=A0A6B0TA54_9EURY|nr:peroxiredoxin family protein [Halovenus carboxidivorans]MXR52252.1 redoxin domain-containing protein [Halovenus carboxidivorans]
MTPTAGDQAPEFEALLCTGESFRSTTLDAALDGGGVLVFFGFAFSAIDENWWKRYDRAGWDEFDVPVLGVSRDGPYAQNAFIRYLESPFRMFSDTDGEASEAFGLLTEREGMADTSTPMRSVFVIDDDGEITYDWVADDWISPVPREEIEEAVADL